MTSYDYSKLDQPEVVQTIFHPRQEAGSVPSLQNAVDVDIPVDDGIQVHTRFHVGLKRIQTFYFFMATVKL